MLDLHWKMVDVCVCVCVFVCVENDGRIARRAGSLPAGEKTNKTLNISNKVLTWELGCHSNRKS